MNTKLNWSFNHTNERAETKIGRFHIVCTGARTYKDGSHQWMIYQSYERIASSKEIITLGKIRAKSIEEVINYAESLVSEIIPDNKTSVLLSDGSTLVVEAKDEGGDYPGVYVYKIDPDNEGETDIACVEMPKDNAGTVSVYVYADTENDDYTHKIEI